MVYAKLYGGPKDGEQMSLPYFQRFIKFPTIPKIIPGFFPSNKIDKKTLQVKCHSYKNFGEDEAGDLPQTTYFYYQGIEDL